MRYAHPILAAAALCATFAAAATPALAITCEGNFQIQRTGARIATPYCQDGNLATVAREYGVRISANEVRENPSEKNRICRFVGADNRVRDTCVGNQENLRDSSR